MRHKQYIWIVQHAANRKNTNKLNWLGRRGLQFLETLKQVEKERCNMSEGLINTLLKNSYHSVMKP